MNRTWLVLTWGRTRKVLTTAASRAQVIVVSIHLVPAIGCEPNVIAASKENCASVSRTAASVGSGQPAMTTRVTGIWRTVSRRPRRGVGGHAPPGAVLRHYHGDEWSHTPHRPQTYRLPCNPRRTSTRGLLQRNTAAAPERTPDHPRRTTTSRLAWPSEYEAHRRPFLETQVSRHGAFQRAPIATK